MVEQDRSTRPAVDSTPFAELVDQLLNQQNKVSPTQLDALAKGFRRQGTDIAKQRGGIKGGITGFPPAKAQALADCIYTAYNSADRQTVTKAGDVVQALAAFCRAISIDSEGKDQNRLLAESFLRKAVERDHFDKHDLHVLNHLLPHAGSQIWPDDLMGRMFVETWSNDSRFVAGRVIVSMFDDEDYLERVYKGKRGSTSTSLKTKREDLVADILLDKVANTDHNVSLKPISQFILPVLFENQPQLVDILLKRTSMEIERLTILSPSAAIHFWSRIAATARTSSLIPINVLNEQKLQICMHHAIDDVRLACWTTLTASKAASDRVEIECFGRIKEWFESNMRVHNADFRGTFSAAFRKFVERLRLSASAAQKQIDKPLPKNRQGKAEEERAWNDEKESSRIYIAAVLDFLQYILDEVVTTALEFPSSTGHARVITALDMIQFLALELEPHSLEKDSKRKVAFPPVFTEDRVEHLLACLGGNFSDIRSRALEVLMLAPSPLPGYSSAGQKQTLLEGAYARLDGNRKSDAEAGSLVLQVLCREEENGSNDRAIKYVTALLDRLDSSIRGAEQELALGMQKQPMHGTLSAIARIIWASSWDHSKVSAILESISNRCIALVRRIWNLSKRILSSEGSNTADHEIARIYDMMEDGMEDEDQDTVHINLLSNCWRAIKESSNLIANIFVVTMTVKPNDRHSYWTSDDVRSIGEMYLGWLYHIRHRGTFSSIAPDFERFVNVTASVAASAGGDRTLRHEWLESQLEVVAAGRTSTTRRSAAIPACILALVQASQPLFLHAHQRLVAIIQADHTPDAAKVHAFHALRVTVLDARQSKILGDCFERTALVALAGCKSADWSVRNSALLLFAHLATRMFGKGLNSPGTVYDKRIGIVEWNSRYPLLLPSFVKLLDNANSNNDIDSSVILVLAMLRHLESRYTSEEQLPIQIELRTLCKKLLASPEIKVRQAAAEAFSSLEPKQTRYARCLDLLNISYASANEWHGSLLVISSVVNLGVEMDAQQAEFFVKTLQASVQNGPVSPLIVATATEILTRCYTVSGPSAISLKQDGVLVSRESLQPGGSLLRNASARLRSSRLSENKQNSVVALRQALLPGGSPDDRIEALRNIDLGSQNEVDMSDLYHRLRALYDVTAHVPLKEAILPALATILAKIPTSKLVSDLNSLIEFALDENRSAESRFAASLALRNITPGLEREGLDAQTRVKSLMLIKRALSDDDAEIREVAADTVSSATKSGYSLCRDYAIQAWWSYMHEQFSEHPEWHRELVRLLVNKDLINRTLDILFNPSDDLFASEPPNLFQEPVIELLEAFEGYQALGDRVAFTTQEMELILATRTKLEKTVPKTDSISILDAGRDERKLLQLYLATLTDIST